MRRVSICQDAAEREDRVRVYHCPHCEAELPEGSKFCPRCAAEIAWPESAALPIAGEASVLQETAVERASEGLHVEPPVPALDYSVTKAAPEAESVPLPIPENIAGALAYITPIPAVAFLYLEPFRRNLFVRFHAFQHIVLWCAAMGFAIAAFVLWMVLQLIPFMRVLVFPFAGLIGLAWLFLWLLLVVKAYHHEMFKLPYIGDFVEEWSVS